MTNCIVCVHFRSAPVRQAYHAGKIEKNRGFAGWHRLALSLTLDARVRQMHALQRQSPPIAAAGALSTQYPRMSKRDGPVKRSSLIIPLLLSLGLLLRTAVNADRTSSLDRAFVTIAGQSELEEVRLARLALHVSSTPQIVAFATQMREVSSDLNVRLMSIAGAQHIALPVVLPASFEAQRVRLQSEQGPGFDRKYLLLEVRANRRAAAAFEHEVARGDNGALRDFARATIPMLEQTIRLAQHDIALD
jgi:predicted outer membrane protein